ncbi:uncharacterized protein LOC132750729 [Ruditapes philippinarum]|uniref:uncharacterized protein LOC132750729 n=1 Tax=Ruditapes philippinarum TaxID=129788 RepID=UPI00295AF186|nr:uncharacterized protein LOC132750729 [Ruditapes philippinarum]
MFTFKIFWIGMAAILSQTWHVASHGRLIQPAQRSSAWRFGYDNPKNYNDNELFCGGFAVQYNAVNKGRCGVCGDPFSAAVKPNEDADGKYVKNGVITGSYVKGDILTAKVDITAYHKGWFEFRLCPLETPTTVVTQECLNQNLLMVAGSSTTRIILKDIKQGTGVEIFEIELQLPDIISCEKCVLQWKYNTGNSWGCDAGVCALGRGNQENFVNCADIKIDDILTNSSTTTSSSTVRQSTTMKVLTSSYSSTSTSTMTTSPAASSSSTLESTHSSSLTSSTTTSTTSQTTSLSPPTTTTSTTSQTTSSPTATTSTSQTTSSPTTTSTTSQTTSSPTTTTSTSQTASSPSTTSTTSQTTSSPTTTSTSQTTSSPLTTSTTSQTTSSPTTTSTSQTTTSPTTTSTSQTTSSPSTTSTTSQTTSSSPTTTSTSQTTTSPTTTSTTSQTTSLSTPSSSSSSTTTTTTTTSTTTTVKPKTGNTVMVCSKSLTCRAILPYSATPGMPKWCCDNCQRGYCPSSHCVCS